MESLQCQNKIINAGNTVSFPTQPTNEFEAQLRREASQVAEAYLLQEVAGVAPEHHVDIHVLRTLHIPANKNEWEIKVVETLVAVKEILNKMQYKHSQSMLLYVCLCPYPLTDGPDGILKVFCRLNLPVVTESADCDKLMLRFLKNSNPPVELGS